MALSRLCRSPRMDAGNWSFRFLRSQRESLRTHDLILPTYKNSCDLWHLSASASNSPKDESAARWRWDLRWPRLATEFEFLGYRADYPAPRILILRVRLDDASCGAAKWFDLGEDRWFWTMSGADLVPDFTGLWKIEGFEAVRALFL